MKAILVGFVPLLLLCSLQVGDAHTNNERLLSQRREQIQTDFKNEEQKIPGDMDKIYRDINNKRMNRRLEPSSEEPMDFSNVVTVECTETPAFLCDEPGAVCIARVIKEQEQVIAEIQTHFPTAKVVATTQKLVNAVYVDLPEGSTEVLLAMDGVRRITPHHTYELSLEDTAEAVGALDAHEEFCATGKGVTVAVLDSGVDYTHQLLGGSGSPIEYAYAFNRPANRDSFFPTERVVDGFDFVGVPNGSNLVPDIDPIDEPGGHGTSVASAILAIAPDVQLVAVRVCISRTCPEFALTQGLEFAMDRNNDGEMEDRVDIINLSLGSRYLSSFHDAKSLAVERAFEMGTLTVIAAGNFRNRPYVMGPIASSPNGLAVAATGHPSGSPGDPETVEFYSSRGPGENNAIKPDIAAPSGSAVALASTGTEVGVVRGTSFSAPVVAGAAALLKERCPSCSPLALKALLMNNANRFINYTNSMNISAPVSLVGSGHLRIRESLDADFWAYSPDSGDVQPSLSLGLVNAASDITITRTIKIVTLSDRKDFVNVSAVFRDPADAASGAVTIIIEPPDFFLGDCGTESTVTVNFQIDASKAPTNHMGVGGDPSVTYASALDENEFDGHVLLSAPIAGKEISMPFHMILRQSANTTLSTTSLPWELGVESSTDVAVQNVGAGVAHLEAFDLIALSGDKEEGERGQAAKGDVRAVGFRALEVNEIGCTYVFEFLVNTWERHELLNPKGVVIALNTDLDDDFEYYVINDFLGRSDVKVVADNFFSGARTCTGFPPDDPSNTRNTLMRVCSEDVGSPTEFNASVIVTVDSPGTIFGADFVDTDRVTVNEASFSAPSYNVPPGETLGLKVSGSGRSPQAGQPPLGLLLITNGFRAEGNTGSATLETETHLLVVDESSAFPEITPDEGPVFPPANDTTGPDCLWQEDACQTPTASPVVTPAPVFISFPPTVPVPPRPPTRVPTRGPTCAPNSVPRHSLASWEPSVSPTTSPAPSVTPVPSSSPTMLPTTTTQAPTLLPSSPPVSPPPTPLSTEAQSGIDDLDTPSPTPSSTASSLLPATGTLLITLLIQMWFQNR